MCALTSPCHCCSRISSAAGAPVPRETNGLQRAGALHAEGVAGCLVDSHTRRDAVTVVAIGGGRVEA